MRKYIFRITISILLISLGWGCSNEDQNAAIKQTGEVSFVLEMSDLSADFKAYEDGAISTTPCVDLATVQMLIANKQLTANITVKDGTTTLPTISLPLNLVGGTSFVTDAYPFNVDGSHSYSISQITITSTHPSYTGVLYASVNCTSTNSNWIPAGCCVPQTFTPELYKKKEINVCVFCAFNEVATKFGYAKWNIDFTRKFCIQFTVSICNGESAQSQVGTGTMKIEKGTMVNSVFTPTKVIETINIPYNETTPASLCFTDNLAVNNDTEYFRYTMVVNGRTFIGTTNVTELLKYKQSNTWVTAKNNLQFKFCKDQSYWFFIR
ncbi:MAG: hypothetical protein RR346_06730 [Bacteroidales bacterium]